MMPLANVAVNGLRIYVDEVVGGRLAQGSTVSSAFLSRRFALVAALRPLPLAGRGHQDLILTNYLSFRQSSPAV